ncbi:hypothetical protein GCM10010531_11270 [Blastococcus jejuensis]|uniref:Uncharacterized protein n=1 Tax=Blastococcus jejuensis TaxID=351224 RepID=A0ABP6NY01_9ACTN
MTAPVPTGTPERSRQRRTRPPTEYWDVFTASWRRREPVVPTPRRGD